MFLPAHTCAPRGKQPSTNIRNNDMRIIEQLTAALGALIAQIFILAAVMV